MGYDDDPEMVDAIALADEVMPDILPKAFVHCAQQAEKRSPAQSIDDELKTVELEKERQQIAASQRESTRRSLTVMRRTLLG